MTISGHLSLLSVDFDIQQELGSGLLGPTFLVTRKETGDRLVCKVCRKACIGGQDAQIRFRKRIDMIELSPFPFIVPYSHVTETDDYFFLFRSFVNSKNLWDTIYATESPLPHPKLFKLWTTICGCVGRLHTLGASPSPLKPGNIFIGDDSSVTLTDMYDLTSDTNWTFQTPDPQHLAFLAPEFFDHSCPLGPHSDIWSLAMILFFVMTGHLPFSMKNVFRMINSITSLSVSIPSTMPDYAASVLRDVLDKTAAQRPPATTLESQGRSLSHERVKIPRASIPPRASMDRAARLDLKAGTFRKQFVAKSCFQIRCRVVKPLVNSVPLVQPSK